jgi:tetratricopeptide (TPR) repeat protein
MENFMTLRKARVAWCVALLVWISCGRVAAQETNITSQSNLVAVASSTNSSLDTEQQLRSHLKLQEQLHSTLLAIEQARLESSEETRTNAEILGARLKLLESSLAQHRELQLESLHSFNRTMLWVVGSIVGVALLALLFTAFSQSRTMNRLAELTAATTHERALLAGLLPNSSSGERLMIGPGADAERSPVLFSTIDRLEKRIRELEHTAEGPLAAEQTASIPVANGHAGRNGGSPSRTTDHASVLLAKGQALLNLGQVENALACFDEAVASSPENASTHLRRGQALERLKRRSDAIASFNQAIALDPSLTQAYLAKGGVFNDQERYAEALECYEQALRSEKQG